MRFQTRQLALFCALAAASVGIQLAPRPPNIEFTSLITFTVGIVFGWYMGALLGGFVMFVNGFLSPWGLAGWNLPFQVVGMSIIGWVGGVYGKTLKKEVSAGLFIEAAVLGSFLTLVYDLITNVGVALLAEKAIVGVLIFGAAFSLLHVASNTVLFGFATVPVVNAIRKSLGR